MVPVAGVEPARYRYHRILSPARLPIPSHRRANISISQREGKIKAKAKKTAKNIKKTIDIDRKMRYNKMGL